MSITTTQIRSAYPRYAEEEDRHGSFYSPGPYDQLLALLGDIALQVDDNDYQGDSRLIYRRGSEWGLLIFGWGSCSGCDALQGCSTIQEITDLANELQSEIKWFSDAKGLHEYMTTKDWKLEHAWHADETKQFIEQGIKLLADSIERGEAKGAAK